MTTPPSDEDPRFADLVDDLLTRMLDGEEPDAEAVAARHPAVAHRVREALELSAGVAGRRHTARPALLGYEIVRELGRGGMGTVYLARQRELERDVALKVLPHSVGLSPHSRARFLAEARALARIRHPHVVGIHRIVEEGEVLAFEMEYVDGPSLQQVLDDLRARREAGETPSLAHVAAMLGLGPTALGARHLVQFFVGLAAKIAGALGAMHAAGLIHRDVKPSNLLLRRDGQPVLVDFGLVRLSTREISRTGSFAGTPVYSAPEQLRGDAVIGPAADVYALGVTLFECLTLLKPFAARTTTEQLRQIETGRSPPLRRIAPATPRDLETIVTHAMEVEAGRRYPDGDALAEDLQRLLDLQPIRARPVGRIRRLAKFLRRHRSPLAAGLLGAALVTGAMLPVLEGVEAAGRRQRQSREHLAVARQHLLDIDGRPGWRSQIEAAPALASVRSANAAIASLRAAIGQYDRALELDAGDLVARRERDVTALALWLRQLTIPDPATLERALASGEFDELCAGLGPTVVAAARRLARGSTARDEPSAAASPADDAERAALGLLGFLAGDFRLCETAWQELSPLQRNEPLVSSALGAIHLADGRPELAHAQLLQALTAFPEAPRLQLQLAEAATAMGDRALARFWLARLGDDPRTALLRRRLELDLRAAGGEPDAVLEDGYRELAALDPADPLPRYRVAQLAQRRGDLPAAARELDALIRQWPAAARFRLDRARIALQQRDLRAYARQVSAVLAEDFGRDRSNGTAADLLEILRIGGLVELYREGVAANGHAAARAGRAFLGGEIPVHGFAGDRLAADFAPIVRLFDDVRRQTGRLQTAAPYLRGAIGDVLVTAPLLVAHAPLSAGLGFLDRLAIAAIPWSAQLLYPFFHPPLLHLYTNWIDRAWTLVELTAVSRPVDLPREAVFGNSLLRIGDVDGDAVDDLLVGCMSVDPGAAQGCVLVTSGANGTTVGVLDTAADTQMFGHALARIGDVDGDGHGDWLIGAPAGSADAPRGVAEIWSSRERRLLHRLSGHGAGFGVAVAGLGDCDADGVPDFAVSTAPMLRNSSAQGGFQIFSGRTLQPIHDVRNDVAGVWFGACMAGAGDVDADGVSDLLVGGNFGEAPGLARVYSGRTAAILHEWSDASPAHGFGTAVLGPGDVDGDGSPDLVVAAVRSDADPGCDQVFVFSGASGEAIAVLEAKRPGTKFGAALAAYGLPSGRILLAIGSPAGGTAGTGAVEFWSHGSGTSSTLVGPQAPGSFGGVIATTSDTDGDARPELFVGCPLSEGRGVIHRVPSRQIRFGF